MVIQGLAPLVSRATMATGTIQLQSAKVRLKFLTLSNFEMLNTKETKNNIITDFLGIFPRPTGICPQPRTPSRGRLLGDKPRFIDGDEVRFSCDRNYDLFGSATLRCVGKKWNSREPVCKGEFANGFTAAVTF